MLSIRPCVCHLPVDQAHDGSLQPHSGCEAVKHVVMMEERLQRGQQEEKRGIQETFPRLSMCVPHEAQQPAGNKRRQHPQQEDWFPVLILIKLV